VTSPRQVFGPARPNRITDNWWEPTKLDRPLTPRMAYYLRRRMWSSTPGVVERALAERGLLADTRQAGDSLTPHGHRVRDLLGELPREHWPASRRHYQIAPSEVWVTCPACGRDKNAELFAWDHYDGAPDARTPPCITCAMEGAA
jgi:hypothetical protein